MIGRLTCWRRSADWHLADLPTGTHAQSPSAIGLVVDAVEQVQARLGPRVRHTVEHCGLPSHPACDPVVSWLVEAFAKAGISTLGPRLWAILQEAGLRPLGMIGIQLHFGPGAPVAIVLLVGSIRTAAPLLYSSSISLSAACSGE